MAINRFHQPIQAEYISQYAPIPFQELVALGKYYGEQRKATEEQLNTKLQTFGKFRSPSEIDTKRYYEESIGKFAPLIEQAAANPDLMKSSAFRSQLQNAYNTVNYANLSMLEESAANQRAGLEMRAKMKAEGKYKDSWDLSDIANYDTLGQKRVFTDITPVQYMNFNEMSNKYFDNLKPGTMDPVWKNGALYDVIGNSKEDLWEVYNTYKNDLMSSPQGQMHIQDIMNDFKVSREDAEEIFGEMIVASQMDRTIRPIHKLNEAWALNRKINGDGDGDETPQTLPTRYDYWDASRNVATSQGRQSAVDQLTNSEDETLQNVAKNYMNNKNIVSDDAINKTFAMANVAALSGDKETAEKYQRAAIVAANEKAKADKELFKAVFKKHAHFDVDAVGNTEFVEVDEEVSRPAFVFGAGQQSAMTKNVGRSYSGKVKKSKQDISGYSDEGYIQGVNATLSLLEYNGGYTFDDPAFRTANPSVVQEVITDSDGSKKNAYYFPNTQGFVLPESIFAGITGTSARSHEFGKIKEAIEAGKVNGVEFIPDGKQITLGYGATRADLPKGKLRIPEEELERVGDIGWFTDNSKMIERRFGGREVKKVVGEDNKVYYEIDAHYTLPYDPAYQETHLQLRNQTPNVGGIGGASQAKDAQMATLNRIFALYSGK